MRINCIPVELLSDQHLKAEYLEIYAMMFTYYRRSVLERKTIFNDNEIPSKYCLGAGHAKFFYNKMKYVYERWNLVKNECINRGYNLTLEDLDYSQVKLEHYCTWSPSYDDKLLNLERILNRIYKKIIIQNKPVFYKYYGKILKFLDWGILYTEKMGLNEEDMHSIICKIESNNAI